MALVAWLSGRVRPRWPAVVLLLAATGCGNGGRDADAPPDPARQRITVWSLEFQPDRLEATKANVAAFTDQSGIEVEVVPIGDDELAPRMERARSTGDLPDVAQLPLDSLHAYARDGLLDTTIAQDALDNLGDGTFSQTALTLASEEGGIIGIPSDGWGQLLIYRKDLFEDAGLPEPRTLDHLRRAAKQLARPGFAGITLPSAPDENFTSEIFEHIALAAGCELVGPSGDVTLDTPNCHEAMAAYVELARNGAGAPPAGGITRDMALEAYFAGRTAMIFWSPFLLDAMAGLRDDVRPTCRECERDPAFLARNSGLVGPLAGSNGASAQYGSISSWGIFRGTDADASRRFVEYMLSDGYVRWLALAPQGKFPVRPGDATDPERYRRAWERLESGVERKAPLRRFYSRDAIASLSEGVRVLRRWAFIQGQAALAGAVRDTQAVSRAVADAVTGHKSPAGAARQAHRVVEGLQAGP
jgi:multiple sugar transport system substrate-binding protein